MERYQEYKDSGEKWLGEIPSHWEVKRLGNFISLFSEKGFPDAQLLSVTREQGVIIRNKEDKEENHNYIPDDLSGYKHVCAGDFVINKMKSWQGSYGISHYDGIVSPAYFTCKLKGVNSEFFSRAIRSKIYTNFFMCYSKGIRVDQWDLEPNAMKAIPFVLPPISEQAAIVTYLDRVTTQIDKAIAQQQRMIDLLNERKQIIIQHAVTKGLAPNAEMVDSGVEWIGTIPKHWETIRLNYCSWIRARLGWKGLKADEYVSNGYPFLSAFNIVNNKMSWEKLNYINKFRFDESPEIKLQEGDILLVKDGAGIGKCARVDNLPYGEATANGSLAFITPNDKVFYKYLHYFIVSDSFGKYKELLITGMGVPHLTQGEIKKMRIPVPPIKEQVEISKYLDHHIDQIDDSIKIVEQRIILLRERKQIIINEVVTGKVKVS